MTPSEEQQVLAIRCYFCWAAPGDWCRTSSGLGAEKLHVRRWSTWRQHLGSRERRLVASQRGSHVFRSDPDGAR